MANALPDFRIGFVVRAEDQTLAVCATEYGVARNLVSFGAVFAADADGNLYAVASPLAEVTYSAHLYPSLAVFCADRHASTVEGFDRHERYDADGRLISGYRILEARDADLRMQEVWSLDAYLADLGLARVDGAQAQAAIAADQPRAQEEIEALEAGIRAGVAILYGGVPRSEIAARIGAGEALLDVIAGVQNG